MEARKQSNYGMFELRAPKLTLSIKYSLEKWDHIYGKIEISQLN